MRKREILVWDDTGSFTHWRQHDDMRGAWVCVYVCMGGGAKMLGEVGQGG